MKEKEIGQGNCVDMFLRREEKKENKFSLEKLPKLILKFSKDY